MSRVVVVHETGGPEVLRLEERPTPTPRAGEVVVRNEAVGLNFIDVYQRTGLYKMPLPMTPGGEGAGVVIAVGAGVTGLSEGDRVLYAGDGAYADEVAVNAARVTALPRSVPTDLAATLVTKGTTAQYLLFDTWAVKPGDTILVHAASGGTGTLLVQWGAALGATVIALAGSDDKVARARANGAAHAFNSREEGWPARVREATGGRGVDVVYDGVGQATFEGSLDTLRPRGLMVSFGNASGPVTGVALSMLQSRGSLYLTRPTGGSYVGSRELFQRSIGAVLEALETGKIRPTIDQRFGLADVQQAHRALEARQTTGATVLTP
ncbi:MAG: quinone oxidoreductase [Devosia sp.]|uniref:quinone oxidoreductase family protein n=1 Tax=Devosia sp. 66-22 TaxID=1895753 RepID=UPI00092656BE|nr:quinone oxidoreductase [Devosia sp. 66-22]MBN9344688.1 quinone oxidoreductase [Devosia sp.]OJX53776.1 MAG: quinone oxidoreductase [Devosia sp. 66-22]